MKQLLNNKKVKLQAELANQKVGKADADEAQKRANEALNNYLKEREAYYEQEKLKTNAQLELIEELLQAI